METYLKDIGINFNFPFVLTSAALIWARCLSVIMVIPFLFGRPSPRTVRIGASVVLTIFLYPLLVTDTAAALKIGMMDMPGLFLKEILFGLSIGFTASLMFYGFQAAGQMIDNQRGVSLARILIPSLGEQASISSNFLFQFAVVLFLVLGGHRLFLKGFIESYKIIPLFTFPESVQGLYPLMELFMTMTAKVIFISIQIAAPVIIAILMADIILGVANRFAPQINVWELGFNIRGYVGVLMLFLSITFIARQIEVYTEESIVNTHEMIERFKAEPPPIPVAPPEEKKLIPPAKVVPIPKE